MKKKKILPIPLILLIPIVMLVVVVVAGIYRFSLTDEEILAKFPSAQVEYDPVVSAVFDLKATNPWTIKVPESNAYAFIDELDSEQQIASGRYDSGVERGVLGVDIAKLHSVILSQQHLFVAPMWQSNQGSGVFYYLALFKFDQQRSRVILVDQLLLGDRIDLQSLDLIDIDSPKEAQGVVGFTQHAKGLGKDNKTDQPFSEQPSEKVLLSFAFNTQSIDKQ